ncbi:MAG TPA: asparagine synthase [Haloplasmataceae bacterium]
MREGLIPTIIGTGVTAAGIALKVKSMRKNKNIMDELMPMFSAGIIGFGIAHVLLGTIDLLDGQ